MLNLELALHFNKAQTAKRSELSTLRASESSKTLKPFNYLYPNIELIKGVS
tara:strand:+ start:75 stop:227 length:153 start_codon:yes stop_codon:yes gene_type:complete